MEEIKFEQVYKIDKARLYNYYERIKNQFSFLDPLKIIAKFLNNQSIGETIDDTSSILNHYKGKIKKKILDFAFEWIRAQKIRLEYKKYLIRAQYSNFKLAVDDCIFLFFLNYDNYMRKLLKNNIKEYEISALYEIFFATFEAKNFNVSQILEKHKNKVPTIFKENQRIDTKIMTLRVGLSEIIKKDYEGVLSSRKEEKQMKDLTPTQYFTPKKKIVFEFNGTLLERLIKTYCFDKKKIRSIEIENAVSQFLHSYFRFGKFYKYEEFKDILIQSLADYINSGLTEKMRKPSSLDVLKKLISNVLTEFRSIHKIKELDGAAWVNDLKPVLKGFALRFVENLF
jgi:hypothetical protein